MARDPAGNLYISDSGHSRVRKINASGIISTVAGNGTPGSGGDGGPATSASLVAPAGLALDGAGNLYIADPLGGRVRKVDTSGNISTVAGTGSVGYTGDGGPATSAQILPPIGLAVEISISRRAAPQFLTFGKWTLPESSPRSRAAELQPALPGMAARPPAHS